MKKYEYKITVKIEEHVEFNEYNMYVFGDSIMDAIKTAEDEIGNAIKEEEIIRVEKIREVEEEEQEETLYRVHYKGKGKSGYLRYFSIRGLNISEALEAAVERFGDRVDIVSIVEANEFTEAPVVDIKKLIEEGERL